MPTPSRELRGLPGLNRISDEERRAFLLSNAEKLKKYEDDPEVYNKAASMLYDNQQFRNAFGEDAVKRAKASGLDSDARNELLREKIVGDAFNERYSPFEGKKRNNKKGLGKDWEMYSGMSTDAKEKLLDSDWKTPEEMEREQQSRTGLLDRAVDFVAGEAIQRYKKDSNQKILDRIYNDDADNAASRLSSEISQAYQMPEVIGRTERETKELFQKAIVPDYKNGNMGIAEYAARYGDGSDVSSEMEDFSIDDMRQVLARKAVYEQYMSPQMAATALNNEAKRYIKDHQGTMKRFGLFAKDVGIAALSYTADKVNGLYNLGLMAADKVSEAPIVYVDDQSNILDTTKNKVYRDRQGNLFCYDAEGNRHAVHQEQVARTTLHNMGKNEDGSDDTSLLNPQYWTKAEQFGTLDENEQKQYEKLGASPYKVAYDPNEERDLWYESFKMMSFGLADAASMLVPFGIGMAGKALSTASKVGRLTRGLGKTVANTSKYLTAQTKTGSAIQGLVGAGGIAYAYQRGAFQETLAQNLANMEESVLKSSQQDVYDQYQNNEAFRKQVDSLVNARASEMKAAYKAQAGAEGSQMLDEAKIDEMLKARAQDAVLGEFVQQRVAERKNTPEFASLQQKAIDSAGDAATTTFLPEALKYGLVNTVGFRKFWYSNPQAMTKSAQKAFKGLSEATTEAGKQRLAVTPRFATAGDKAKRLGQIAAAQARGGAWTNGTDDMMVDAAERINEDSFNRYLQAYETGVPIADVYSVADGLYSYWKGLNNSLGQETTWEAAAVGGLGSLVSASPNMANIAHLASKEGREAFRDTYSKKPVYETVNGVRRIKRDDNGQPVMENVPLSENWRERANYFIQNGVLNNYYSQKAAERSFQEHADYVNKILDDNEDFRIISDVLASDIEDTYGEGDRKTNRFLKALGAIKMLEHFGNKADDPATLSSVIMNAKDAIDRVANEEFSEEEAAQYISEYNAQHPEEAKDEEGYNERVLSQIVDNAKKLQEARDAYNEAEKQIPKIEKSLGRTIAAPVREKMKENWALKTHWRNRLKEMKDEIHDSSNEDTQVPTDQVLSVYGSKRNAEAVLGVYAKQQQEGENSLIIAHKRVEQLQDQRKQAKENYDNAKTSDEKYLTQMVLTAMDAELENAQQQELFIKDNLEKTQQKKQSIEEALKNQEEGKEIKVLSADEIFGLPATSRAMMLREENATLYSKAQLAEIEKLKQRLLNEDADHLQKVQDIATLTNRIAQVEDAYTRMAGHPEAARVELENQKDRAAKAAYKLVNERNADAISRFTTEMNDGLRLRRGVTPEVRENLAYGILKHFDPLLLDIIDEKGDLAEFQKQLDDAKDWAGITSDITDIVANANEDAEWKQSTKKILDDVIDASSTKDNLMSKLEQAIDIASLEDKPKLEKVLSSLENLGYLRDNTVVENRKQKEQREAEAKKKLEEEQKKEAEAKKAAEEAAKKAEEVKPAVADNPAPEEIIKNATEEVPLEEEGEKQKPLWNTLGNGLLDEDAEDGSVDTREMWSKGSHPYQDTFTVVRETTRDIPLIKFQLGGIFDSLSVNPDAWEVTTDDTKEALEKANITKETPFTVNEMKKKNGEWFFVGKFAGVPGQFQVKMKDSFDLSRAIEDQRIAREAQVATQGINTGDANLIDDGSSIAPVSSTVEQQASEGNLDVSSTEGMEDTNAVNERGEKTADGNATTLSGTAMKRYESEPLAEDGILEPKKGKQPNDKMNWFFKWLDTFVDENGVTGIKLQNIDDTELHKMLKRNPHLKLKFMCTRANPKNITADSTKDPVKDEYVGSHLFLVTDYNDEVAKLHNKNNGGVISSEGKQYLIMGTVGYGDTKESSPYHTVNIARRDNLFNVIFGGGTNNGLLQQGRHDFFKNHPSERFRVLKVDGKDVTTEIVPNSLTPGYIVKQIGVQGESYPRRISEIASQAGLKMEDLGWYIQEYTNYIVVNADKNNVMPVRRVAPNAGSAFVLVPAGNGKLVPSHIDALFYNGMKPGALLSRVNDLLGQITLSGKSNYATRLAAAKKLANIFHLNKNGNMILVGKENFNNISLAKKVEGQEGESKIFATINLDADNAREQFMEAFATMNPRVNITRQVLGDVELLKQYDEAGALNTDIAMMHTVGSVYSIYPIDASGKMVSSVPSAAPTTKSADTEYKRSGNQKVPYGVQEYEYTPESRSYKLRAKNGEVVTEDGNPSLYKQLEYNRQINAGLSPAKTETQHEYYVLSSGEHPLVIDRHPNTKVVKELSEEASKKMIQQIAEEKAKAEREAASKAKLNQEVELENQPEVNPETGMLEDNTQSQAKKELEVSKDEEQKAAVADEKSREIIDSPENKENTQTFKELISNKKYKMRILKLMGDKFEDSPVKFNDKGNIVKDASKEQLMDYLKKKGITVDAIGTSDAAIEGFIHKIECL